MTGGGNDGGTDGGRIDTTDTAATTTAGETIGSSPDFFWPTASVGVWNNQANAYDQVDGTYATATSAVANDFSTFNDSVPGTDTIAGIEVKVELSGSTAAGTIGVQLSWDGGVNWTSSKTTPTLTITDAVVTLGAASDTWGRSWSASDFDNTNFAIRLTGAPSSNEIRVDALQVKVYHQATGGSSGGGGRL